MPENLARKNITAPAASAAPFATACAGANAFVASTLGGFPRTQNQDIAFGKLDYLLNATNHISASFNFDNFRGPNSYSTATSVNNISTAAAEPRPSRPRWNM